MKKSLTILQSLFCAFVFSLFPFGCAEKATMQPIGAEMESMEKEPVHKGMGAIPAPALSDAAESRQDTAIFVVG